MSSNNLLLSCHIISRKPNKDLSQYKYLIHLILNFHTDPGGILTIPSRYFEKLQEFVQNFNVYKWNTVRLYESVQHRHSSEIKNISLNTDAVGLQPQWAAYYLVSLYFVSTSFFFRHHLILESMVKKRRQVLIY